MIAILSPAKTLDFDTPCIIKNYTRPNLIDDSQILINELKKLNSDNLSKLMKISSKLGSLNYERYKNWTKEFTLNNSKQSIFCFRGGVYKGLDVDSLSDKDLMYSQDSIRILSGLHGILRPFDLIMPYRLEMGTKLKNSRGKNLYDFWGDSVTNLLNKSLEENNSDFLLNLASNEYFSVLNPKKIKTTLINVKFLDKKKNDYKIISFFAKKARGTMAAFLIKNKVKDIDKLKDFSGMGYSYEPKRSSSDTLTFIR